MEGRSYRRSVKAYTDEKLYEDYCRAVREGDGAAYAALESDMAQMLWNLLGSYLQCYGPTLRGYREDWEDAQAELWEKLWRRLPLSCLDYPSVYQLVSWIHITVDGTVSNLKRKKESRPDLISMTPKDDDSPAPDIPDPSGPEKLLSLERRERCGESLRALLGVRRTPAAIFAYSFCRLFYPLIPEDALSQRTDELYPEESSVSRRLEREYRAVILFLMREDVFENFCWLFQKICCQKLREDDFNKIDEALERMTAGRKAGEKTFGEAGGNIANIDTWNKRVRESLQSFVEKGESDYEA